MCSNRPVCRLLATFMVPASFAVCLQINDSYSHPGKWQDVTLVPTMTRSEANQFVMSHIVRGLERNSVYEAIIHAKNRYGWNEVSLCFWGSICSLRLPIKRKLKLCVFVPSPLQISDIHQFYTRNVEVHNMDDMDFIMSSISASGAAASWRG